MKRLSALEMYRQLTSMNFIVSVMLDSDDCAVEITSRVEKNNQSLADYSLDRAEVNPYDSSLIDLYVNEL